MNGYDHQELHVLLVDDHPVVRVGFAALLGQLGPPLRIHEADNAGQAVSICLERSPRFALIDLSLNGELCLDLIKRIRFVSPATAILVVSMHDERIYAERALHAGASGYVMKHNAAKSIVQAVRMILEGQVWLSEEMRNMVVKRFAERVSPCSSKLESLSNRELEVFQMIGKGLKKSDIAQELRISSSTIETYRANIKRKLGIDSGAELYRRAFLHFQG
ncbi:MAG TPA: response regulator transcription factor [Noviherbaspirillum sp.]|uniref:response regulator transcription factor n=1 Tax=Noviherbaspirillum sp. TaxID=1926288 RepID=UPI002D4C6002|nr:response regulator transcription factor [Noviherbaspirillum sp.]HYD95233.1 response regulator transcription factor [Noviherbaspirillum sp.]